MRDVVGYVGGEDKGSANSLMDSFFVRAVDIILTILSFKSPFNGEIIRFNAIGGPIRVLLVLSVDSN